MGLVPFRQPSTLFCCCHLVLHVHIFCCIVENKPSLSLANGNSWQMKKHEIIRKEKPNRFPETCNFVVVRFTDAPCKCKGSQVWRQRHLRSEDRIPLWAVACLWWKPLSAIYSHGKGCTPLLQCKSTLSSILTGTVKRHQLSDWVIITNGDGGCWR